MAPEEAPVKGVADTSWLIAHMNADDRFHKRARAEAASAELVHIPAAIWVEFLNVLQYRFGGHPAATKAADEVRGAHNVEVGDHLDDDAVRRLWRRYARLTYADAAAVAEAKRLELGLLTFEDDQRRALESEKKA